MANLQETLSRMLAFGVSQGECVCKLKSKKYQAYSGCKICSGTGVMHVCPESKGSGLIHGTMWACGRCHGQGYDGLIAAVEKAKNKADSRQAGLPL